MSAENFEQFYTDLLTALRVSLTQVSGDASRTYRLDKKSENCGTTSKTPTYTK